MAEDLGSKRFRPNHWSQAVSEDIQSDEIVRCFDEMHSICWGGVWWRIVAGMALLLVAVGIGSMSGADWVIPVGVIVVIVALVVPHVTRIHRGYARLRCPSCREEVGGYETKQLRTYLVCKHCGKKSPTDCGVDCEGGNPIKIE